jgi:hypothetical protein
MADLMWATADGRRRLVAPTDEVAAFVTAVYRFDEVVISRLTARATGGRLTVDVPDLGLRWQARGGRRWPLPLLRPAWITRHVAGPPAWRLLGVRTYGVSPTGVREWYRASWYRPLVEARADVDGADLDRKSVV